MDDGGPDVADLAEKIRAVRPNIERRCTSNAEIEMKSLKNLSGRKASCSRVPPAESVRSPPERTEKAGRKKLGFEPGEPPLLGGCRRRKASTVAEADSRIPPLHRPRTKTQMTCGAWKVARPPCRLRACAGSPFSKRTPQAGRERRRKGDHQQAGVQIQGKRTCRDRQSGGSGTERRGCHRTSPIAGQFRRRLGQNSCERSG